MAITAIIDFVSFLVFIHELGHFLAAKRAGIRIEEFGFGYPPRLARLGHWGEVEITLNAIPFGGFVRMAGEEDPAIARSFASKSKPIRLAVLFAYVPILALGAVGAARTIRRGWPYIMCWLPAVYFTVLHMIFVSSIRYRQPAMLGVIVLAAGVVGSWRKGAKTES